MAEPVSAGPGGAGAAVTSLQARAAGPPFLRLDARTGRCLASGPLAPQGVLDVDGALELGVPGAEPVPRAEPTGTFGGRTTPRGLAFTPDGWLLLADPADRVVRAAQVGAPLPADGVRPLAPLWPARPLPAPPAAHDVAPPPPAGPDGVPVPDDPFTLVRPTDVAIAPNGDVVVADPGAGRLLVLAWPLAVLRHVVAVPGGAPTAVAFDAAGRALVADPARRTVDRYDRRWRREPGYPHPSTGLVAPVQVAAVRDPGPAHTAHVLVLDGRQVVALDGRGRRVAPLVGSDGAAGPLPALTPGPLERAADGTLRWYDEARPRLDPVPLTGLPLTGDGRHLPTGLPLLALPRRVRRPRSGVAVVGPLDGGRPGFAWDRLVLDVDLPPRTRVLLSVHADDSPLEPDRVAALPAEAWTAPLGLAGGDVPEVLVQASGGRYAWLRLELFGDGTATPAVRRLDVHAPRRSSVRHLPSSFRSDPESLHFLDRFLAYFDTVLGEVVTAHRDLAALLDPQAVPEGAALDWLGSWFDLRFLAEWPPTVRRRMVAEAVEAARARGTVAGLRRVVQHHTGLADPLPVVVEHFALDAATAPPVAGAPLDAPGAPHTCTLVLPRSAVVDDAARARLATLVAAHTPAHVRVHLRLVDAGLAVGRQAVVGVDALLGPRAPGVLGAAPLGAAALGDAGSGDAAAGAGRPRADLVTVIPTPAGAAPACPLPRSSS